MRTILHYEQKQRIQGTLNFTKCRDGRDNIVEYRHEQRDGSREITSSTTLRNGRGNLVEFRHKPETDLGKSLHQLLSEMEGGISYDTNRLSKWDTSIHSGSQTTQLGYFHVIQQNNKKRTIKLSEPNSVHLMITSEYLNLNTLNKATQHRTE